MFKDGRFRLTLQSDGNVGLYGPRVAKWATNTVGRDAYRLTFQGDGNFVLLDSAGGVIWVTAVAQGPSRLTMQNGGNLVVYLRSDGAPVWASGTVE